ncbi:MAG: helix-turn-helix domain-containing protein [Thermoplasmatota archaeon]
MDVPWRPGPPIQPPRSRAPSWRPAIVADARATPGTTLAEVARAVGAPRSTTYRHAHALRNAGQVRLVPEGRLLRVYPASEGSEGATGS